MAAALALQHRARADAEPALVCGPATPSAVRPWLRCQRSSARWVAGPKTPSGGQAERLLKRRTPPPALAATRAWAGAASERACGRARAGRRLEHGPAPSSRAERVWGPATPSAVRPWALPAARGRFLVAGPKSPSTASRACAEAPPPRRGARGGRPKRRCAPRRRRLRVGPRSGVPRWAGRGAWAFAPCRWSVPSEAWALPPPASVEAMAVAEPPVTSSSAAIEDCVPGARRCGLGLVAPTRARLRDRPELGVRHVAATRLGAAGRVKRPAVRSA